MTTYIVSAHGESGEGKFECVIGRVEASDTDHAVAMVAERWQQVVCGTNLAQYKWTLTATKDLVPTQPAVIAPDQLRVICADDDDAVRALMTKVLLRYQVIPACCSDGVEAAKLIQQTRPHIVFLDIQMPGLTGLEVAQQMQSDSALRLIPIVILTGRTDVETRSATVRMGLTYLIKPLEIDEIPKCIGALTGCLL
jgi:CheY-like chemotaxis protein